MSCPDQRASVIALVGSKGGIPEDMIVCEDGILCRVCVKWAPTLNMQNTQAQGTFYGAFCMPPYVYCTLAVLRLRGAQCVHTPATECPATLPCPI